MDTQQDFAGSPQKRAELWQDLVRLSQLGRIIARSRRILRKILWDHDGSWQDLVKTWKDLARSFNDLAGCMSRPCKDLGKFVKL